jgi:hypothetical protein
LHVHKVITLSSHTNSRNPTPTARRSSSPGTSSASLLVLIQSVAQHPLAVSYRLAGTRNTDNVRGCSLRRVRDERDEVGLEAGMYVNITGSERLFEPLRGVDLRRPSFAGQPGRTRDPGPTFPPATPISAARLVDLLRGEVLGVGAASDLYACDVTDQEKAAINSHVSLQVGF